MLQVIDIPVAHVDDSEAVEGLLEALQRLHGSDYAFAVGRWTGRTRIPALTTRVIHRFIVAAEDASILLSPGDLVRGPSPTGPYRPFDDRLAVVTAPHQAALWPGDVVCITPDIEADVELTGQGTYFEVITEQTAYRPPKLALLRHLTDRPGGCAAYPGAFRREALPPLKPEPGAADQRGPNRVNEHTLDMRVDRKPTPIKHFHGPVAIDGGCSVNHSETAIVLPRSVYGLPEVEQPDQGRIRIYRRPQEDVSDQMVIPVRPGSIVVTPATTAQAAGHCFENAFAMLVAIPGFVSPYNFIET
jgi:hypothetical protein